MTSLQRSTPYNKAQTKIRVAKLNLYHCEAALDLFTQFVRQLLIDFILLSQPIHTCRIIGDETKESKKRFLQACTVETSDHRHNDATITSALFVKSYIRKRRASRNCVELVADYKEARRNLTGKNLPRLFLEDYNICLVEGTYPRK